MSALRTQIQKASCRRPFVITTLQPMNTPALKLLFCCQLGLLVANSHGELETGAAACVKSASFLAPIDSPDYKKYAPDREVEIVHLALDVTPDFTNRTVEGKAIWNLKPIAKPLQEIKLDAVDLK